MSSSEYERILSGKEQYDFDPAGLLFEGQSIPYDRENNTAYIPQSVDNPEWEGTLSVSVSGAQICILNDSPDQKQSIIEEGRTLRMAVVRDDEYEECGLVFTGLPAVCMSNSEGVIEGEEEVHRNHCGV